MEAGPTYGTKSMWSREMDTIQSQTISFIREYGSDDVVDFGTVIGEFLYDDQEQRRAISDDEALERAFAVLKYFMDRGEFELVDFDSTSSSGFRAATYSVEEACQLIKKIVEQEGIRGDYAWVAILKKKI